MSVEQRMALFVVLTALPRALFHGLVAAALLQVPGGNPVRGAAGLCEPVRIPMCLGMPYNRTRMPNLLHHSTQENAILAAEQFDLLAKTRCSDTLVFFVCALYAPICAVDFQNEAVPPCRSVCERARAGCEPLMNRYNVSWPPEFQCDLLPQYDKGVCITPEAIVSEGNNDNLQSSTPPVKSLGESFCHCPAENLVPTRKIYMKRRFDYVLKARVKSVDMIGELTFTQVQVEQVIKQNRVPIHPNRVELLWTISACACPRLSSQVQYLVFGFEDPIHNRLLYTDGTLAVRAKEAYIRKIMKWEASLQKKMQRKHKGDTDKVVKDSTTKKPKTNNKEKKRRKRKKNEKVDSDGKPATRKEKTKIQHKKEDA